MREKFHKFLVFFIVKQMKKLSNLRKIFLDVSLSSFSKISYLTNFLFNIDDKNFFPVFKNSRQKNVFLAYQSFFGENFSQFSLVSKISLNLYLTK